MKELPVGISDFKRIMEDGLYFVDKSLLIKKLAVVFDGKRCWVKEGDHS